MELLSDAALSALEQTVQHNCAISDARHARDYSLCIYLLRMREYFRWKNNLPLVQKLDIETVGDWVTEREIWWDEIEEQDYQPLTLDGNEFDPFDHKAINRRLRAHNLVYTAGVGRMGQPHFALATLIAHRIEEDVELFDCGEELVRDTVTVPAMAQGQQIFIRRDSIRRLLWELYDDWCLHRKPGGMAAVVRHFNLQRDASLNTALTQASHELASLIEAHERGEIAAGVYLGERYSQLTLSLAGTRAEHYLRALRDLLADTLSTWPLIVERHSIIYLEFWLAGLNGLRLHFMERDGTFDLLSTGTDEERLHHLNAITEIERQRWGQLCKGLMSAFENLSDEECLKIDAESTVSNLWQAADNRH